MTMHSPKVVQDSDAYHPTHGLRPVIGVYRVVPAKGNCPVRLLLASLR
jgi:hypothetical protein